MVRCGVVSCGVVWCGVVWCDRGFIANRCDSMFVRVEAKRTIEHENELKKYFSYFCLIQRCTHKFIMR